MSQELSKAHFAVQNLQNEKAQARVKLEAEKAEYKAQIAELEQKVRGMDFEFDEHWRQEKAKRQEVEDNLIMAEFAKGAKATSIMKLLNSRNTVKIYALKKRVDEGHAPEVVEEVTAGVPDTDWLYHDFKGTHSYAFSTDFKLVKKHGIIGTPDEGLYFVADYTGYMGERVLEFKYGDREFFDKQSKTELLKRTLQLDEILNDVYTGKMVVADNPYRNL